MVSHRWYIAFLAYVVALSVPFANVAGANTIDFDVLMTVDAAALTASGTNMAGLCPRITVSVSIVANTGTYHALAPQKAFYRRASGVLLCETRYPRMPNRARLYITASYAGNGGPFGIGASSLNFWENPTTLTGHESLSPYTHQVYRGLSVTVRGQAMPHPTDPHRRS
jgi:hypothetical protein